MDMDTTSSEDGGDSEFLVVTEASASAEHLKRKRQHMEKADEEDYPLQTDTAKSTERRSKPTDNPSYLNGIELYEPSKDLEMVNRHCYLCLSSTQREYPRFYGMLAENLGKVHFETIIDMMYQSFDVFIHPHTVHPVKMTRADIRMHVLHHMEDPLMEAYIQIRQYKLIRNLLMDTIVQANARGDHLFDYKAINTIEKINCKIIALQKEKPREGLFVHPGLHGGSEMQ